MTEIPEHLLKRSKERRSAMGLGGDADAGDSPTPAPAESAPAPVETAAVAARSEVAEAAPPPPPEPVPPYIEAARSRRRIPYWAMPVLALLPLWAALYWNSVRVPPVEDEGLTLGAEVYSQCASCHGATGGGGIGAQLSGGEVLKTFPDPIDQMMWINLGAAGGAREDGTYGDLEREGGPHNVNDLGGVMPAYPDLAPEELAAVTRYIRETLSGEPFDEATAAEYDAWAEEAIAAAEEGILPSERPDAEGG